MRTLEPTSLPRVADVHRVRGRATDAAALPDLVLEVPHGATREAHFDALRGELRGDLAADLKDFFFVNTDVGAPEVAEAVARHVVEAEPDRTVLVIRCLLPRTFVDCNRLIDPQAAPSRSEAGEVTPGMPSYVRHPHDVALLLERHAAYRALVERAFGQVCGAGGGHGVMVHTYAPRSVDVAVDEHIVRSLRAAYQPDRVGTWPLRPPIDLITCDAEGTLLASRTLVERVREAFGRAGTPVADSEAYTLHPVTVAHALAVAHPDRTLCLEFRRDLLVHAFTPFAEMQVDPARVERHARPLAEALRR
jgi:hypothetical protein